MKVPPRWRSALARVAMSAPRRCAHSLSTRCARVLARWYERSILSVWHQFRRSVQLARNANGVVGIVGVGVRLVLAVPMGREVTDCRGAGGTTFRAGLPQL